MANIVVDKSKDHAKQLSICFLPQHRCQVIRVNHRCLTANIGIAWHVDASSIVRTLTDNRKLANQIATLLPIVERYSIDKPVTEFHSCKRRLWFCWSKWSLQNVCREIQCLWFNTTKRTYGLFSLSHARNQNPELPSSILTLWINPVPYLLIFRSLPRGFSRVFT